MAALTFDHIIQDIRRKIYYPVYLLHGEEPYFIDAITDLIEESILTDTEKEFNQTVVYGRDIAVGNLIDIARRYPMMANYQVVIVREAQEMDEITELEPYLKNLQPSTILVLAYKYRKIDQRKNFAKIIEKSGVVFHSARLYDDKIPAWISKEITARGFSIKPDACQLLADYLGNDLSRISNELNKLIINLPVGSAIDAGIVERNIGISKDYNVFELQNALGAHDVRKANRIISYFTANPKQGPMVVVLTILYSFFMKVMIYHQLEDKSTGHVASALSVNPFFVKDYIKASQNYSIRRLRAIIGLLREYDLRVKGVNNGSTAEGELLREMVYKILH